MGPDRSMGLSAHLQSSAHIVTARVDEPPGRWRGCWSVGVGAVHGLLDRSAAKLRNGLIGGAIGGLIGGFLFDPIAAVLNSGSGMSGRVAGFVIMGLCIGAMIAFVQVVMRDAWLTVMDGMEPVAN